MQELQVADSDPNSILSDPHEKLAIVPLLSTEPPSKVSVGHISRTATLIIFKFEPIINLLVVYSRKYIFRIELRISLLVINFRK